MKVKKLIEELNKLDQESIVGMDDGQAEECQSVFTVEQRGGNIVLTPSGDYKILN